MKKHIISLLLIFLFSMISVVFAEPDLDESVEWLPVNALLGEKLSYNVSFLWFKKIARGEIRFETGEKKGTYLATLTAKTRGMAAFFTSNRVETYTTLMEEGPDGLLRPLLQTSDTQKSNGSKVTHRQTSYAFDFATGQVTYRKLINGDPDVERVLRMDESRPTYDFLTAFYNFRLGRLGAVEPGRDIKLSAFSRKGPEEIVISRLFDQDPMQLDFSEDLILCKVLMTPDTFKTKGRDVFVGFDNKVRPQIAVIKNVIGLGDVHGKLIQVTEPNSLP